MIAPLRQAHRTIFVVLALGLPLVFGAAVATHRAGTAESTIDPSRVTTPIEHTFDGCWGALPVRLTMSARQAASGPGAEKAGASASSPAIPPAPAAGSASDAVRTSPRSAAIVQFSDGTERPLADGDLMVPTFGRDIVIRIEMLAPPRHPALFVYWLPGIVAPSTGLGPGARRLARLRVGRSIEFEHSPASGTSASLALYSLGHDETVGVIHLRPNAITMSSCG